MNDWNDFCSWIVEDLYLDNIPIEWSLIQEDGYDPVVRIDLFKAEPYHVTVGVPDESRLVNHEVAYSIAYRLMFIIRDAIQTNSPRFYIPYVGKK